MILLKVKNLKTYFDTPRGLAKAVDGNSFSLQKGEILGIVGESGAGKSMTGFSILNLIDKPGKIVEGEVLFDGKDLTKLDEAALQNIRGNEIAMIFQDAQTSLNPVLTIGEQLTETLRYHQPSLTHKKAYAVSMAMLQRVGLPSARQRMQSYPHQLSGGMKQRIVIAIAMLNNPQILIADEPTTALDVTIQAQILYIMKQLCSDFGSSMIFISHDIAVISQLCDSIAVMYAGRIVEYGSRQEILSDPKHPYTQGLIACLPSLDKEQERLYQIPGDMPSLFDLPQGCYFKERCPIADSQCDVYPQKHVLGERIVYCHKI
ncbi:ABC transporter ATP-binding protein [Sulfurovum sp. NBC37-1]|uniref:ABC transporter ATP-binding protein n=1 Tax=Sulfurovum sp. (strain NBC37-1) TaxID=387093 RepID=UPI00015875FB|nr:ABC transporter ATP-binding protein [Sulfurovum sp. NBC37-1]BAF71852.1 dipeptide ABC transporter, ATP-binding protein [Sulfurovum sp. NBC37-1]